MLIDLSILGGAKDLWEEWRFESWHCDDASGLYRRASFEKTALLGEIGRYYADDYIVWNYQDDVFERLMADAKPSSDLMVQRYIFVCPEGNFMWKSKSFLLGIRGYAEFYRYVPLGKGFRAIKDLTPLIDMAWKVVHQSG